jgi:cytochrome c peroxidase
LVALGAELFRDKRLSADHKLSCASCHVPERGFIDGSKTARGKGGRPITRNTPALWDLSYATAFYWDGRSPTLDAQIVDAIERTEEMDSTVAAAVLWLSRDPEMVARFARARRPLNGDTVVTAIATYQRSLASAPTRFDRWVAGDETALTPLEVQGFGVFTGPGRCLACHGGWRFTDERYHRIGLPSRDPGRAAVKGTLEAAGGVRAFKTPSLREVRWTAPYMHDGSLATLKAVLDHYTSPRLARMGVAAELRQPLQLSTAERQALLGFLAAISSDRPPAAP